MNGTFTQRIKSSLVEKGHDSSLTRTAIKIHALTQGYKISYFGAKMRARRDRREMILRIDQLTQAPLMLQLFDLYFRTIRATQRDGFEVLDFSEPGVHTYLNSGVSFEFPSVPEDDVMEAYTRYYLPRPGDVVWDAGAHAGATTFFLSQMVGPSGKVFAFEPDAGTYEYLQRNIDRHSLKNVVLVKKGLSGNTGKAMFNMDGTMAAGIHDFLIYSGSSLTTIDTITIADACEQFGSVPAFVKMDIEGAEVASVQGSADFLRSNPIHFAIESDHKVGDQITHTMLDSLFPTCGYSAKSGSAYGTIFTWASRIA